MENQRIPAGEHQKPRRRKIKQLEPSTDINHEFQGFQGLHPVLLDSEVPQQQTSWAPNPGPDEICAQHYDYGDEHDYDHGYGYGEYTYESGSHYDYNQGDYQGEYQEDGYWDPASGYEEGYEYPEAYVGVSMQPEGYPQKGQKPKKKSVKERLPSDNINYGSGSVYDQGNNGSILPDVKHPYVVHNDNGVVPPAGLEKKKKKNKKSKNYELVPGSEEEAPDAAVAANMPMKFSSHLQLEHEGSESGWSRTSQERVGPGRTRTSDRSEGGNYRNKSIREGNGSSRARKTGNCRTRSDSEGSGTSWMIANPRASDPHPPAPTSLDEYTKKQSAVDGRVQHDISMIVNDDHDKSLLESTFFEGPLANDQQRKAPPRRMENRYGPPMYNNVAQRPTTKPRNIGNEIQSYDAEGKQIQSLEPNQQCMNCVHNFAVPLARITTRIAVRSCMNGQCCCVIL